MKVILIAAVGQNNEIGMKNKLIWPLKDDLLHFQRETTNHVVVMGRKTYESIGHTLKKRCNIVMSTAEISGVATRQDPLDVIAYCRNLDFEKLFVIGGENVYKQFLPYADELCITHIQKTEPRADTFFPAFKQEFFPVSIIEKHDAVTDINYSFVKYKRVPTRKS